MDLGLILIDVGGFRCGFWLMFGWILGGCWWFLFEFGWMLVHSWEL